VWSQYLFLEGQAVSGSFACKAEAEFFKSLHFSSLALIADSSHAHLNSLQVRNEKKANEQRARNTFSRFLLSQSLCRQLLSRISSN